MSTGDHLLHVLNALESRAVVLEEELKEIDSDVNLNATLARKYGNEFFQEGADVLNRTRVRRAGPRPRARARAPVVAARRDPRRAWRRLRSSRSWPRSACSSRRPPSPSTWARRSSRHSTTTLATRRVPATRARQHDASRRARTDAHLPPSAHVVVAAQEALTPVLMASMPEREPEDSSPKRILATSPILSEKRMPRY